MHYKDRTQNILGINMEFSVGPGLTSLKKEDDPRRVIIFNAQRGERKWILPCSDQGL